MRWFSLRCLLFRFRLLCRGCRSLAYRRRPTGLVGEAARGDYMADTGFVIRVSRPPPRLASARVVTGDACPDQSIRAPMSF